MHDVRAKAIRKGPMIHITVLGSLANTCLEARVVDWYPGGGIVYFVDPGSAQVFIEERQKTGSPFCLEVLMPWVGHANIHDSHHDNVEIFINRDLILSKVPVVEESRTREWKVIALVGSTPNRAFGCSIIPGDAFYPMIYCQVFGPASKVDCEKWLMEHCVEIAPEE